MLESFFQQISEKIFSGYSFRVCVCLLAALAMFSCTKDDVLKMQGNYGYPHYPSKTYRPNSLYYSRPYEVYPKNQYFDQDQYYVLPYGYNQNEDALRRETR